MIQYEPDLESMTKAASVLIPTEKQLFKEQ